MPPIPFISGLLADPVWQWVLVAGLPYLFQFLHAKGTKLPLLEALVSLLGGAVKHDKPEVPAPTIQNIVDEVTKLRQFMHDKMNQPK